MFRLIGFLGGTILFFILAVRHIPGFVYYYICAVFCLTIILLLIIFRVAAKYLDGFWRVWCTRLQRWISTAVMCLSRYTDLPQYSPSHPSQPSAEQSPVKAVSINHPFWWGLVQLVICFFLTAFAPLLMIFVLFCYGEAIYRESQYRGERREYKEKREIEVARQSARMSLEIPLQDRSSRRGTTQRAVNYIPAVPVAIQLEPVPMSHQRKKTITNTVEQTYDKPSMPEQLQKQSLEDQQSISNEAPPEPASTSHGQDLSNPQHELEMDFNQRIVNNPHARRSIPLNMTRVTEESRSYIQSGDFDRHSVQMYESSELRESLPRYRSPSPQNNSPPRSPTKNIGNDKL